MNRRIPLTTGAAAAGLFAAAFLPMAVAFADDHYSIVSDDNTPVITSETGLVPFYQEVVGTDTFDANQGNPFTTFGEFTGQFETVTTNTGFVNELILDTGGQTGGLTVPTGSVFDFTNFGGGFSNEYADIAGTMGSPNTITDIFTTPFGDFNIPTTFDAIAVLVDTPAGFVIP